MDTNAYTAFHQLHLRRSGEVDFQAEMGGGAPHPEPSLYLTCYDHPQHRRQQRWRHHKMWWSWCHAFWRLSLHNTSHRDTNCNPQTVNTRRITPSLHALSQP